MDEYDRVTRCKCNYRRKQTKCVRTRPDPTAETAPYKRVQKRCTCGFRYNKSTNECIPAVIPKQVQVLQPLIEIAREGKKCPPTFEYNYKTKKCVKCPNGTKKYRNRCILLPTDDKEPTPIKDVKPTEEKVEVLLPAPDITQAKPAPYTLAEYMNVIEKEGNQLHDARYKAGRYMIFIYIYLLRKYANDCSIFKDAFHLRNDAVLNYYFNANNLTYPPNLGHQMQQCVLRGSELIFITLHITDSVKDAHVNILIYRPFKKTIERFEPHGQETGIENINDYALNSKLKRLFEEELSPALREYTPKYKTPYEICPNIRGFQGIENMLPSREREHGYCQLWSMFMMETTLLNPTLNTRDIIQQCLDIGKRNPEYFKNVIRGYTFQMAKELQKFLGPDFDIKAGTHEARSKFDTLDAQKLILDTMSETSKKFKPQQPIVESDTGYSMTVADINELDKQVDALHPQFVTMYHNYITIDYNPVMIPNGAKVSSVSKDTLKNDLLRRNITWENLMLRIYNTLFVKGSTLKINCYKYVILFNEYPHEFVRDNLIMQVDRMEVMELAKKKYPIFHDFWGSYNQILESSRKPLTTPLRKSIEKGVNQMTKAQLTTCLILMKYKKLNVTEEQKKYIDDIPKEDKQEILNDLLVKEKLTDKQLLEWAEMY